MSLFINKLFANCFYRSNQLISDGECIDDEKMYAKFFSDLNNSLFQAIIDAASTSDKRLAFDAIRKMGMHPKSDLTFLEQLIELHGVDVQLEKDSCCSVM